jgi:hypothetical protein
VKVRIVEEDKLSEPKPEIEQKFVFSLKDQVEFFYRGLRLAGTLVQAHGDIFTVLYFVYVKRVHKSLL